MEPCTVSLKNITKTYPGVTALDAVSIDFRKGEVHALLGENGAGKSTLIKIIAGAQAPDSGTISIDGTEYRHMTPNLSRELGIEVIYQEFNLIESLSAAENIGLGAQKTGLVDFKQMNRRAQDLFDQFDVSIDPRSLIRELSSSEQQIVEIAKAVSRKANVLIMDEPTAPLTVSEVTVLFKIIRAFKDRGVTIIYISHRIDELFEISDRVTVMRDGKYVTTKDTAQTSRKELIDLMVGRDLTESYPLRSQPEDRVLLEAQSICGNGDRDISFTLHAGEILGVGGLVGAGRTELAKVLYGAAPMDSGRLLLDGVEVDITSPQDALRHGIGLIPENRKEEGCLLDQSVAWNITFTAIRDLSRHGIVQLSEEQRQAQQFSDRLKIKTPSLSQQVKNLSGGNQQKVVLAKTLAARSKILLFDEPTRGIDVGARQEIYQLMSELAQQGHAILMITSDMEELLGMSDRIMVIAEGRIAGFVEREDYSQRLILELASGLQTSQEAVI